MTFTEAELAYLDEQAIGRLATSSSDGGLQNNPVSFHYNAELGTIDIGGYALSSTRKYRNVQATGQAAFVIDDIASVQPWRARGVEIRGRAEAVSDVDPLREGFSREVIRIHPRRIISWGVDAARDGMYARTVHV